MSSMLPKSLLLVLTALLFPFSAEAFVVIDFKGNNNNNLLPSKASSSSSISFLRPPAAAATTCLSMATTTTTAELPSRQYVAQGMEQFRQGDVLGSIKSFDASVPPGSKAYLWQRGLSYYYADEFSKGSQQFKDDVLRSPLDVEEIVWDIACLLRMDPTTFPPKDMMSLPPGKMDRRPIMATVYSLFRGEATEQELAKAGHNGGPGEEFYALLYLGLFNEARGENAKAENYMKSAVQSKYAKAVGSRDYMVDVAKVHCKLRHWHT